jgi:hypothetical protein
MSRNWVVVPARHATQPIEIGSLESILGLLKSLKVLIVLRFMHVCIIKGRIRE